jgi:peroxiredoxin
VTTAPATLEGSVRAAEAAWLEAWTSGPTEAEGFPLRSGAEAPDFILADHTGQPRALSEFWSTSPALLMFWRHFGCGCGVARAGRLKAEWRAYRDAGLNPVVIGLGDAPRAASYRLEHDLPGTILCDPDHEVYQAYGVGQWPMERVLYDAPAEAWSHSHAVGVRMQQRRRELGRPLVDDPWRAVAEYVIGPRGRVRLAYSYQYCEDFPDPRVLTAAARLSVAE